MVEEHKGYTSEVADAALLIEQWNGVKNNFKPLTPITSSYRQKDVGISGDPKFHEMKHFLTSHSHQDRLVARATGVSEGDESPRKEGVDIMNSKARQLAHEARGMESPVSKTSSNFTASPRFALTGTSTLTSSSWVPPAATSSSQSGEVSPTKVESPRKGREVILGEEAEVRRRLQWREELDRNLRRLMTDVELGRDPAMKHHGHKMVCDQFDRLYGWFKDAGDKEVAKEQQGPAFVRYDPAKPVVDVFAPEQGQDFATFSLLLALVMPELHHSTLLRGAGELMSAVRDRRETEETEGDGGDQHAMAMAWPFPQRGFAPTAAAAAEEEADVDVLRLGGVGRDGHTRPLSPRARAAAKDVVGQLVEEELHELVRGSHFAWYGLPEPGYYVGNTPAIPRLRIPALKMQDAGQGFRDTEFGTGGTSTAFPSMLALASTWDEDLVRLVGGALGTEFKGKGANCILGPSINVHRAAAGGRNFEYLSGEDGHLGAKLTAAYVKGVQEQGVIATAKHFAFNEQETNRMSMDARISERTQWELYYLPFRAAAEAGVGAVMCAYNKVNGTYACHNSEILNADLRGKMNFSGFVMSDWTAMHSKDALGAGLDQEQPGIIKKVPMLGEVGVLVDAVIKTLARPVLETAAMHVLTTIFRLRLDQDAGCAPPNCTQELASDQTKATTHGERHEDIALRAAESGIVLLKNEQGLLPLRKGKLHRIAVVGNAAADESHGTFVGKGSGFVKPDSSAKTPLQAIEEKAAKAEIQVLKPEGASIEEASSLAQSVDAVIVVIGTDASEGMDRASLGLGNFSDAMIEAVAGKAPTIVLLQIPGAVLMPWRSQVAAVASQFMGGVATGTAWANFLFGHFSPRGRLPIMMPETSADVIPVGLDAEVTYAEGLLTSYRSPSLRASFPFGHGLAFTTFQYSGAHRVEKGCEAAACVEVLVKNAGQSSGEELVQAYVHFPEPTGGDAAWVQGTPEIMLKAFRRTKVLQPDESQTLRFDFPARDLKLFCSERGWVLQRKIEVRLGASSKDIRQAVEVELAISE
ncbi:bglB [Symbiodinium pilosum]|uniref:Probable beta-glucosidase G n=1 Tax=Symbiodinium pilosum TaxID=2952 RepID=A0A812P8G8_SYMPI|nr:bglB [Symbiodinium pilosum]